RMFLAKSLSYFKVSRTHSTRFGTTEQLRASETSPPDCQMFRRDPDSPDPANTGVPASGDGQVHAAWLMIELFECGSFRIPSCHQSANSDAGWIIRRSLSVDDTGKQVKRRFAVSPSKDSLECQRVFP